MVRQKLRIQNASLDRCTNCASIDRNMKTYAVKYSFTVSMNSLPKGRMDNNFHNRRRAMLGCVLLYYHVGCVCLFADMCESINPLPLSLACVYAFCFSLFCTFSALFIPHCCTASSLLPLLVHRDRPVLVFRVYVCQVHVGQSATSFYGIEFGLALGSGLVYTRERELWSNSSKCLSRKSINQRPGLV